ncbi:thiol reductant ABC exporter subunit CydD [Glaciibacter sp. 2TAF33]|uniref:thiol reductant ABC exporter subunit CydD n=1 Tax=Glaciibacter sp. 2TAF33 TaxID=3233015 RepID=UPI003F90ED80
MKPLDPRLLRHARAARRFLAAGAAIGLAQTLVVIAFSWLLSQGIVLAIGGHPLPELAGTVGALAGAVIARAALSWLQELNAARGAAHVKSQLRAAVLAALAARGPDWTAGHNRARLTTTVTSGLDALDTYFARYLPQLLLTVIATPVLILVMTSQDLPSGITVILALPLIPVFMVLIGWATRAAQQRQWDALQRLGAGFLDVVGGLATLKIFGRERRQPERLRAITDEYRTRTMSVLRVSFLSGFVLEFAASLSVAVVAVSIGLRLVDGSLGFATGLFVLLLAPEVFLPVRQVGAQFHAAADGVAAADEVFGILDDSPGGPSFDGRARRGHALPASTSSTVSTGSTERGVLRLEGVAVPTTDAGAPRLPAVSASWRPGDVVAVSGPSGAGKSTLLGALAGFLRFDGRIILDGRDVTGGPRDWLAWSGQRPGLLSGTIADNVALGDASVDPLLLERALSLAGAGELDPATALGVGGAGLSGGQAQRVAVARAVYRSLVHGCPVIALDEPSAALDGSTEAALVGGLRTLADEGRIVVVVSHRTAVLAAATRILRVGEVLADVPA